MFHEPYFKSVTSKRPPRRDSRGAWPCGIHPRVQLWRCGAEGGAHSRDTPLSWEPSLLPLDSHSMASSEMPLPGKLPPPVCLGPPQPHQPAPSSPCCLVAPRGTQPPSGSWSREGCGHGLTHFLFGTPHPRTPHLESPGPAPGTSRRSLLSAGYRWLGHKHKCPAGCLCTH